MSRLEIIHLRSSGEALDTLSQRIRESIKAIEDSTEVVKIYRRDDLVTDIAIHIYHPDASGEQGSSALGLRLASALRAYGLVGHSFWREMR